MTDAAPVSTIVAMGGGGFSMEPENPLLDDYILSLTRKERPRVCFLATASGDADGYIEHFQAEFAKKACEPDHLKLFGVPRTDIWEFLLSQDVIYVGGGNTANMLAVWRVHRVDQVLRKAWEQGTVLCGLSAGMICWFEAGTTNSFGPVAPLRDGLGFLPGSACPHYDSEPDRRPTYHRFVEQGFPAGYAADDGAAVVFHGRALSECVSSRPEARCYRVHADNDRATEEQLLTRYLGA